MLCVLVSVYFETIQFKFPDTLECSLSRRVCRPTRQIGVKISSPGTDKSEGGMIRLETLIELKLFNSTFSSLSSY